MTETNNEASISNKAGKHFLTDESFDLLRQAQQRIHEKTDMTPSLRKLINTLVTPVSVEALTNQFIDNLK
jgi:hypothetical protein